MPLPPFNLATRPVRHRRKPAVAPPPSPPPAPPPTLVAASLDDVGPLLLMAFDEAIDISAIDLSQIFLNDAGIDGVASLSDPLTLQVALSGEAPVGDVELSSTDTTGIVAAAGGAMWSGSSGVGLPFP